MHHPLPAAMPLAVALTAPFACAQLPDWVAPPGITVLDTGNAVLQTASGPVTVTNGLFRLGNVTIPAGATVRGVGDLPMIWVVDHLQVDGELSVSGEPGDLSSLLGAANIPVPGGRGGAAGGHGGAGSPQVLLQSFAGQPGNGPGNSPGLGGGGGLLSLNAACGRGSGGGGGAFATHGDPHYLTPAGSGTSFVQRLGVGGFGCLGPSGAASRALPGGGPGGLLGGGELFFGLGYDVHRQIWVQGALPHPIGGAGGGGGGDLSQDHLILSPDYVADARGGGGGGGGGCLIVAAGTDIVVGPGGRITANGGHG
ncbi:MAG: hypothetical protein JNN13_13110, partial [Planctomycetes bacterium]|nr:hypothetical protein [Planctomycetota bacterium]